MPTVASYQEDEVHHYFRFRKKSYLAINEVREGRESLVDVVPWETYVGMDLETYKMASSLMINSVTS
jgi:hypothetical protein